MRESRRAQTRRDVHSAGYVPASRESSQHAAVDSPGHETYRQDSESLHGRGARRARSRTPLSHAPRLPPSALRSPTRPDSLRDASPALLQGEYTWSDAIFQTLTCYVHRDLPLAHNLKIGTYTCLHAFSLLTRPAADTRLSVPQSTSTRSDAVGSHMAEQPAPHITLGTSPCPDGVLPNTDVDAPQTAGLVLKTRPRRPGADPLGASTRRYVRPHARRADGTLTRRAGTAAAPHAPRLHSPLSVFRFWSRPRPTRLACGAAAAAARTWQVRPRCSRRRAC